MIYYYMEYRFIYLLNSMENSTFPIKISKLVDIVSKYQTRSFAEEVDYLEECQDKSIEWLYNDLRTHPENGISNDEQSLEQRRKQFGSNEKYVKDPPGFCELFCNALEDFTLRILMVASVVSIGIEVGTADDEHRSIAWIQGFAVMVAVMISATVTAVNDYQKEREFQKLNLESEKSKLVNTIRDGKINRIHQDLVLVGDIVNIESGMEVPADGVVIQGNQITTDESAMTGQSHIMNKNIFQVCLKKKRQIENEGSKNDSTKNDVPSPVVMGGTKILGGQGRMLILVIGDQSCNGKIRKALDQEEIGATPLQMKLQKIAEDIGRFGLYSAITILVVLLIRFAVEKGISREWNTGDDLTQILHFFILAITVIVVAIPEGLPLAVTLSLAFSVKKMLDDENLVRKMEACETMGGANNICSDKTGTLTTNIMTLTTIWNGKMMKAETYDDDDERVLSNLTNNKEFLERFTLSCCANSSAELQPQSGSATQLAILKFMKKAKVSYEVERKKYEVLEVHSFSSSRKRMSKIILNGEHQEILVKGASEIVIKSCTDWYNMETNQIEPITSTVREQMQEAIKKMAENSLRTLCLAYKQLRPTNNLESKDDKGVYQIQKSELVCLALIGIKDIHRKQVPDAIRKCKIAGIKVRMVTGDNLITAKAIAKEIGLLEENDKSIVMQGTEFIQKIGGVVCKKCQTHKCKCARDLKESEKTGEELRVDTIANAEQFDNLMDDLIVLARSRPQDKYALVTGLRERGEVVAVTGDGTNDAPALKKADVGFAMGEAGTEVAKNAADIILVKDNFTSIVKAVLWGRNIYDSIRKFIQFQLTVNVVAVVVTLVGAALMKTEILRPIQMLWINLIMDTLASLALATEPPTEELLNRKPHSKNEYIISRTMFKHIIGQSIFQIIVVLTLVFIGEAFIPEYIGNIDQTTFKGHPQYKFLDGIVPGTVRSGRMNYINGEKDYKIIFEEFRIYSRHFTFIFNCFVMMQIFNFLNCRKLHEQKNIFEGITRNGIFIIIVIVIFLLQIILVTFAGVAFGVYSDFGLTIEQWLISIGFGSISLVINFFLKMIPIANSEHGDEHEDEKGIGNGEADPRKSSKTLQLKRSQKRIQSQISKNHIS